MTRHHGSFTCPSCDHDKSINRPLLCYPNQVISFESHPSELGDCALSVVYCSVLPFPKPKTLNLTRKTLLIWLLLSGLNAINPGPTCTACLKCGKLNQLMTKCMKCKRPHQKACLPGKISYSEFLVIKYNATWECGFCDLPCDLCNKIDIRKIIARCHSCKL